MKPTTCIRLILPSHQNVQSNNSLPNTNLLQTRQTITLGKNNLPPLRIINGLSPQILSTETRCIIRPSLTALNLQKSFSLQKTNDSSSTVSVASTHVNSCEFKTDTAFVDTKNVQSSSTVNISMFIYFETFYENLFVEKEPVSINKSSKSSSSMKRTSSTRSQITEGNTLKSGKKTKLNQPMSSMDSSPSDTKQGKRRFWTEAETNTFIQIWSDYYAKLTSGGSRHAPIYNSMAAELNKIFEDRCLSGLDVKTKISNLSIEYRKKKKEQSGTGASPCSWPYFDSIDKLLGNIKLLKSMFELLRLFFLLGERAYMDDSLLTDSMKIAEESVSESADSTTTPDLNSTQVSRQAEDIAEASQDSNENANPTVEDSNNLPSTLSTSSSKDANSKQQKKAALKKKRTSEAK